MNHEFTICESLTNRFDRRLNNGCCDLFWCQCIDILNAYIYASAERAIWSNILNLWIWLCLKANKLTDAHHLLVFFVVYDSAAFV